MNGAVAARFCVLDIETAPADELIALVQRGGDYGSRSALHSITAVTMLTFSRGDDGSFADYRLTSLEEAELGEADLLVRVDAIMREVHDDGGTLATFAGASHDLPTLVRRAGRHWLFDAFALPGWLGPGAHRHVDLMRSGVGCVPWGRPASLVDACAAFGIPALLPTRGVGDEGSELVRKGQVDVLSTYLLLLYKLARDERGPEALLRGWDALARHLAQRRHRPRHVMPFMRHSHLETARRLLGPAAERR